jgi:transposase
MEPMSYSMSWLPMHLLPTKDMMLIIAGRERLQQQGKTAVIPPKCNRTVQREYDKHLYKARHLIENFFAQLKQYRAIATRYDKRARNFLGAIYLAAAVIWLN